MKTKVIYLLIFVILLSVVLGCIAYKPSIHTATIEEIQEIRGFGDILSTRVLSYLDSNKTATIDDIDDVEGLFGTPLLFNPKGGNASWYSNSFNGTFSDGKPISIMIHNKEVIRDNSCHYIWRFPESVLWIKEDGSHGVSRVETYTQIPGYKDIVTAIGGVGISNYNPALEGFSEFKAVNIFTNEEEEKDFSDVLDKTYHSVFGFRDDLFFSSIMYGTGKEIQAECLKQGFKDVIMGDGRSWAACNTDDYDLHLDKPQYSMVQMINLVDIDLNPKESTGGKMKFENGILTSYNKPFKIDLIPKSNKTSRPQYKLDAKHITIHNTGNKGASAENNSNYVDNASGYVSWHFTIGNNIVIQELPIDEVSWHAGDGSNGEGNRKSISLEIAEVDGAYETAVEFIKELLEYLNFTTDQVFAHKHWSGKECPRLILPKWDMFISELEGNVAKVDVTDYKALYEEAQAKLDKIGDILWKN